VGVSHVQDVHAVYIVIEGLLYEILGLVSREGGDPVNIFDLIGGASLEQWTICVLNLRFPRITSELSLSPLGC
jgi:hypothetical protein